MIFSSVTFLFYFLPIFLVLYYSTRFKNTVLLLGSLFFYSWGEIEYTFILIVSIIMNHAFGLWVGASRTRKSKWPIALGITANLLLIGFFKYFNFFMDILNNIVDVLHFSYVSFKPVHLPLGISFFTFQAMSYLVDVYRGNTRAERDPLTLGLYISMFPQLIAGPIVRFKTIVDELHDRTISIDRITFGVKIFIIGLAQKVLIANTVAVPADAIFSLPHAELTTSLAWLGIVSYTIQIYFDFAGYSNMAIGLGHMFGFTFPKNFNYPYISRSITEFWRRWHISLTSWFRDYLYVPLGGNRISKSRTYLNLIIVFVLCGLWHGASWTFIFWGIYHGMFLIIERAGLNRKLENIWWPIRNIYVLLVVIIGWVFFRSESHTQALDYLGAMFGYSIGDPFLNPVDQYLSNVVIAAITCGVVASTPILPLISGKILEIDIARENSYYRRWNLQYHVVAAYIILILLLSISNLASGTYNPFIYFRF
jgi:alginate O-acetyltransferase complex protein AlgI